MNISSLHLYRRGLAMFALASLTALNASALIVNGSFESGLTGWTRVDQIGSDGTFALQTGILSPVNGFAVPPPPAGASAVMTDAAGPGSHILYQDFIVPTGLSAYTIGFSVFVNNGAANFFTPATLDFATPALNQRARVDIIRVSADPFSLATGDILQNLFETQPGDPLVSGYTSLQVDITSLLQANQGQTLRLRLAETDNVAPFNFGVDNIAIQAGTAQVPDTLPAIYIWLGLGVTVALGSIYRRRACSAV